MAVIVELRIPRLYRRFHPCHKDQRDNPLRLVPPSLGRPISRNPAGAEIRVAIAGRYPPLE
jgi:hypothetical protein